MLALKYAACKQQEILFDAGRSDIEPSDACADVTLWLTSRESRESASRQGSSKASARLLDPST